MKLRPLAASIVFVFSGAALACGPDFPFELIQNRTSVLQQMPSGSFAHLSSNLLGAPRTDFKPAEDWESEMAWKEGLTEPEIELIEKLRDPEATPETQANVLEQLPEDLRDYEQAALLFRQDVSTAMGALKDLEARYEPSTRRGLFARYTRARGLVILEDSGAAAALQAIRTEVASGVADPAGLGVASFGEEARIYLVSDPARAVALYAEQAARGSISGQASLKMLAVEWLKSPDALGAKLSDPLTRKLLVGFAFSRAVDLAQSGADPYDPEQTDRYLKDVSEAPPVLALLDALRDAKLTDVENADQIAAIAYRAARFEEASGYAAMSKTALAAWVRAKLALRSGNTTLAQTEYAQAASGFPESEDWGYRNNPYGLGQETLKPACRVRGEAALIHLDRREYVAAVELLYPAASAYWTDLARLAERVLSVAELKTFVDQNVKLSGPFESRKVNPGVDDYYFFDASARPDVALRQLLARRLMRSSERASALQYFDDTTVRGWAQALNAAHERAAKSSGIAQAEALYEAARLERIHGMELLGFELAPDGGIYAGSYPLGSWADSTASISAIKDLPNPTRVDWIQRENALAPSPDERYQYRLTATQTAEKAAAQLPTWSQAYAATLCHAARWQINHQPQIAARIYQHYLRTGPWVSWGRDFAQACPVPDFAKAQVDQKARDRAALVLKLRRASPWLVAITGLLLVGGLLLLRARRKR